MHEKVTIAMENFGTELLLSFSHYLLRKNDDMEEDETQEFQY